MMLKLLGLSRLLKYPSPIPRFTLVNNTNSHYRHLTTTHPSLEQTRIPFNKAMRLVITGSSGSVGKRVVKLALERGHSVIGVDIANPTLQGPWTTTSNHTFKTYDLTNFDAVLEALAGCDAVINLAAHPTPLDYKIKTHNKCVMKINEHWGAP